MNSAEITRARPELVIQAETLRHEQGPAVGEIQKSEGGSGDVSDETRSGLFRLAEFIKLEKTKPKKRDTKQSKAFQAYESMKNFKDRPGPGQVFDSRI
jgi:hypothetical protein